MPVFNLTVPDTSPLIVYGNGTWHDSSHADPEWSKYTNGTFHATEDNDATATLTFNGSAVYVVGARRSNHAGYVVSLDNQITRGNGHGKGIFNSTLYSQGGLGMNQHELVLQNTWSGSPATWLDVDYILVTSGDGNPDTSSIDVTLDDNALNITYSPGWESSPNGHELNYFMQTMHRTNIQGSYASVLFYGNAITLYGTTSLNHGLFSVALDGISLPYKLNGVAPEQRWQNMLYYSGGLSTAMHNMTIAHADPDHTKWFDLDKVVVSSWPGFGELTMSTPSQSAVANTTFSSAADSHISSASKRAIVAICVCLSIIITALLLYIFTFVLRRRRMGRSKKKLDLLEKEDVFPPSEQLIIDPFPVHDDKHDLRMGEPSVLSAATTTQPPARSLSLSSGSDVKYILPQTFTLVPDRSSYSGLPPPAYNLNEVVTSARKE